jgi:hypothetical protein
LSRSALSVTNHSVALSFFASFAMVSTYTRHSTAYSVRRQ